MTVMDSINGKLAIDFLAAKILEQIDRYERGEDIIVGDDVSEDSFRRILQRTDMDQELMSMALSLPVYHEIAPKRER